jgi:hypothetical protein
MGDAMTLTVNGPFYSDTYSRWPADAYPAGDHEVWAYVDSWSDNPWGWVNETDEDNNRYGPVQFTAPESASGVTPTRPRQAILPRP